MTVAEHDGICRDSECPAHRVGFQHEHMEGTPARMTVSTEAPQSAVEPNRLGEFVEVVVRVPIDRSGAAQAVWGVPGDYTHDDLANMLREQYPSPAGFVADWWPECAQVAVRIRARQGQDMLRDETVNIWGGGVGDAVEG